MRGSHPLFLLLAHHHHHHQQQQPVIIGIRTRRPSSSASSLLFRGVERLISSSSSIPDKHKQTNDQVIQVTGPTTKKLKAWESGAELVKTTTTTTTTTNNAQSKYVEHIREIHDPSLHIKTIEDELKGTIGRALGKQGEKILMYMRAMEQERTQYFKLLDEQRAGGEDQEDSSHNKPRKDDTKIREAAEKYNQYRKDCLHARWELIVHRQAVGFIVGNHKHVMEKYPIGEPLPTFTEDEQISTCESGNPPTTQKKKTFGDQLDWWERIGRWR